MPVSAIGPKIIPNTTATGLNPTFYCIHTTIAALPPFFLPISERRLQPMGLCKVFLISLSSFLTPLI